MLKANKLFAMAAKLEEEGIITPNTEVEVSASVSVTPEEQEKIDEALTEVEEIATAESELDESVEEVEELEEAEATLTAIRDTIKRDGIVTPQLYAFLQDTGYLDAIAAFQKNVSYPATEAISNVSLNKQYADAIIAGCEAGIESINTNLDVAFEGLWTDIKANFNDYIAMYNTTERKLRSLHDTLKSMNHDGDLKDTVYAKHLPSFKQMQEVGKIVTKLMDDVKAYKNKSKSLFSAVERGNTGVIEQFVKNVKLWWKNLDDVSAIYHDKPIKMSQGKVDNIADAGFTYENLTGEAFDIAIKCVESYGQLAKNALGMFFAGNVNLAELKKHPLRAYLIGGFSVPYLIIRLNNHVMKTARAYNVAAAQAIKASKKVK